MRFFKCERCGFQFVSSRPTPGSLICGALVGFIVNENNEEVPVGCGGTIVEITYDEATSGIS